MFSVDGVHCTLNEGVLAERESCQCQLVRRTSRGTVLCTQQNWPFIGVVDHHRRWFLDPPNVHELGEQAPVPFLVNPSHPNLPALPNVHPQLPISPRPHPHLRPNPRTSPFLKPPLPLQHLLPSIQLLPQLQLSQKDRLLGYLCRCHRGGLPYHYQGLLED